MGADHAEHVSVVYEMLYLDYTACFWLQKTSSSTFKLQFLFAIFSECGFTRITAVAWGLWILQRSEFPCFWRGTGMHACRGLELSLRSTRIAVQNHEFIQTPHDWRMAPRQGSCLYRVRSTTGRESPLPSLCEGHEVAVLVTIIAYTCASTHTLMHTQMHTHACPHVRILLYAKANTCKAHYSPSTNITPRVCSFVHKLRYNH